MNLPFQSPSPLSPIAMAPRPPAMPNLPFAPQQQAFGGVGTQRQPSETTALGVLLGTAGESFADTATFGIAQPDIVSPFAEVQHPIATTIGNVAGTLAGFLPSFGASAAAVTGAKTLFKAFKFSERVFDAATKVQVAAGTAAMAPGASAAARFAPFAVRGAVHDAPIFALYETAREFVRQTKQNDPDAMKLVEATVGGAMTGWFMGAIGTGFQTAKSVNDTWHPIKAAFAMGGTMAAAQMAYDGSTGEDITSKEYLQGALLPNLAIGTALGLYSTKGWRERTELVRDRAMSSGMSYLDAIKDKDVMAEIAKYADDPRKLVTVFGKKEDFAGFDGTLEDAASTFFGKFNEALATTPKVAQKRWHTVTGEMGLNDADKHELLKSITGKTSSKDLDMADWNDVQAALKETLGPTWDAMGLELKVLLNDVGGIKMSTSGILSSFTPADRVVLLSGMRMVAGQMTTAKALGGLEANHMRAYVSGANPRWNDAFDAGVAAGTVKPIVPKPVSKMTFGQKAVNKVFGKQEATWAERDMSARLQMADEAKALEGLTEPMKKLFTEYRNITNIYFERVNASRIAIGLEPIEKREFYMHHIIDIPKIRASGTSREDIKAAQNKGTTKADKRSAGMFEVGTEKQRTDNLPYIENPYEALVGMVDDDIAAIYMREPQTIFKEVTDNIRKADPSLNNAINDIQELVNKVVLQQATPNTVRLNESIERFFTTGEVGKGLDKWLAGANIDVTKNPVGALSSALSSATSKAFITFNPALDLLNRFQWSMMVPLLDFKSTAMALTRKDPAGLTKIKDNSLYYKQAIEAADETNMAGGAMSKGGYAVFKQANVGAINTTMRGYFFQGLEHITNPKRFGVGLATAEGAAKRAELRAKGDTNWKNYLTQDEQRNLADYVESGANNINFLYGVLGAPLIQRSGVAKPFTTLMSYPMNYMTKYVGENMRIAMTGTPTWAKARGLNVKLPWSERMGLVKGIVGMAVIVAAIEQAFGLDYSNMTLVGLDKKDDGNWGLKIGGIANLRPNPVLGVFNNLKDYFVANDDYTRNMASARLRSIGNLPIPYIGVATKLAKTAQGEREPFQMFAYKKYERKAATPKTVQMFPKPKQVKIF